MIRTSVVFTSSAARGGAKASPLVVSTKHGQRCNRDSVLCEVSVIPLGASKEPVFADREFQAGSRFPRQ